MTKSIRALSVAVLVLITVAGARPAFALALGEAPPTSDVGMKNVDGKVLTIADVKGAKGTLVLFTCNHCPWVKAWESRMVKVAADAKKRGIGVIAINSNDPQGYPEDSYDNMVKRAKDKGYGFPYVVDATSDVARAFGATHTPEAFLFDAQGKLVYHGAIDDNARQPKQVKSRWLADAVSAVASGKAVPVAETKSLGCSIKFRGEK
jgi:peroxiredoxin